LTPRRRVELAGLVVAALLAWLVVYPLVLVLIEGLRWPSGWTLEHIRRFVSQPTEWQALWGSLWVSVASVALAGLVGIPLAVLIARYRFPGRRVLGALLALPAALPPLVGVLAFLFLYGENGFAGHLVRWMFRLDATPWRLEGAGAVLLVHAYSMYVYFYLLTRAALAGLDGSMLEAAASLGAGRWRTIWRVVVPSLRPALLGASLLVFMTSLASFSAPYIFGGGFRVLTTQIVSSRLNGFLGLAMVETMALLLLALAALWLLRTTAVGDAPASKGVPPEPRRLQSPLARFGVPVLTWGLALVLLLPHVTLLIVSLVPRGTWTIEPLPPAYTLANFASLIRDPVRLAPVVTSLWMATVATAGAVAAAVVVAILAIRRRVRVAGLLEALVALPWAVPGTVIAIAIATAFSVNAPWAGRFVLVGTMWILPLAYLVRNLPITGRTVLAGFRQLDPSLDEAGASLGAGPFRILRRVTLPLLRPALAAGAALAFVTAFGDFVTSILLYTYDTRPISLEILASLRQADVGVAAAYGVLLMAVSAVVFWFAGEGREART
jgi:iron(III) transport system permease protein